jgi:hypothetical protein
MNFNLTKPNMYMSNSTINNMEACGNGLWRLRRNATGLPLSSKKWIHVAGPYYREASAKPTVLDLLRAATSTPQQSSPIPSTRE